MFLNYSIIYIINGYRRAMRKEPKDASMGLKPLQIYLDCIFLHSNDVILKKYTEYYF